MKEIQRLILSEDDESSKDTLDIVSKDTGDSIVWLFRKVFSSSPNLPVDLLSLMVKFFIAPTKMEKRKVLVVVVEGIKLDDVNGSKAGPLEIRKYRSWSNVGDQGRGGRWVGGARGNEWGRWEGRVGDEDGAGRWEGRVGDEDENENGDERTRTRTRTRTSTGVTVGEVIRLLSGHRRPGLPRLAAA